jgi:hypothetical protein
MTLKLRTITLWVLAILMTSFILLGISKIGIDFKTFYGVARLQGQHQDIYSQVLQASTVSVDKYGTWYYFHPPQELLIFRPLTHFPIRWAFFIWCLVDAAIILGSALLLHRIYPDFPIIAALALPFPLAVMLMGQDSALILAGTVLAFACFIRKQDFAAGLMLSLCLIKPQFAVPIVAMLAFRYWRVLAGFAVGSVIFAAGSVWMVGIQGLREMAALGKMEGAYEMMNQNTNLNGLIYLVAGHQTILVIALSAALVTWAALLKIERDKAFAVAVVVGQLVCFHGHLCDMLLLLIPIACFWKDARTPWVVTAFTVVFLSTFTITLPPFQLLALPLIALLWVAAGNTRAAHEATVTV